MNTELIAARSNPTLEDNSFKDDNRSAHALDLLQKTLQDSLGISSIDPLLYIAAIGMLLDTRAQLSSAPTTTEDRLNKFISSLFEHPVLAAFEENDKQILTSCLLASKGLAYTINSIDFNTPNSPTAELRLPDNTFTQYVRDSLEQFAPALLNERHCYDGNWQNVLPLNSKPNDNVASRRFFINQNHVLTRLNLGSDSKTHQLAKLLNACDLCSNLRAHNAKIAAKLYEQLIPLNSVSLSFCNMELGELGEARIFERVDCADAASKMLIHHRSRYFGNESNFEKLYSLFRLKTLESDKLGINRDGVEKYAIKAIAQGDLASAFQLFLTLQIVVPEVMTDVTHHSKVSIEKRILRQVEENKLVLLDLLLKNIKADNCISSHSFSGKKVDAINNALSAILDLSWTNNIIDTNVVCNSPVKKLLKIIQAWEDSVLKANICIRDLAEIKYSFSESVTSRLFQEINLDEHFRTALTHEDEIFNLLLAANTRDGSYNLMKAHKDKIFVPSGSFASTYYFGVEINPDLRAYIINKWRPSTKQGQTRIIKSSFCRISAPEFLLFVKNGILIEGNPPPEGLPTNTVSDQDY